MIESTSNSTPQSRCASRMKSQLRSMTNVPSLDRSIVGSFTSLVSQKHLDDAPVDHGIRGQRERRRVLLRHQRREDPAIERSREGTFVIDLNCDFVLDTNGCRSRAAHRLDRRPSVVPGSTCGPGSS